MSRLVLSPLPLGMTEFVIILVAVLLIFGSGLLSAMGRTLGQVFQEFRLVPNLLAEGGGGFKEDAPETSHTEGTPHQRGE
ncbi:MAG: twin-arginine translocase TatA/TatE family subunit [Candidatus Sumerlaeia bacterium]|nr:twin-arginine translocase TatA/TatE family subunit [Candidatus Sumerlaeia bacterium]